MKTTILAATLGAALAALTLGGCDRASMQNADRTGAAVGQKADDALDRTRAKLAEVGRKAEQKIEEAGERTQQAFSGDAADTHAASPAGAKDTRTGTGDTGKDTRAALSDAAITASIKTDFLKDPDLSVLKIDVDTRDGVVTLNGLADNDAARTRAERIAEGIKGVRQVRNFLVTKRT